MISRSARFGCTVALVCLTCTLLGSTFRGRAERDGPPPAYTGGFGEPDCTTCHLTGAVNSGTGTLTLDAPVEYAPGRTYTLTVAIAQEYLTAAGFQLSVRHDDGRQGGTLAAAPGEEPRLAVTTGPAGVQYIHHVYAGTHPVAADTARWQVSWTAPGDGAVVFHVAGNAADDDESPMGDMIYAKSISSVPGK